jgi:hypothetical protein
MKNPNKPIRSRIRDFPACSAVPQPTAPKLVQLRTLNFVTFVSLPTLLLRWRQYAPPKTLFPVYPSTHCRISKDDSLQQYGCGNLKYCKICVTLYRTTTTQLTSNCQSAFALSRLLSINHCIRNLFQLAFAAALYSKFCF